MNSAIREWFNWRGWLVAWSAVAIALTLLAILSPGFRNIVDSPNTAAWASAIATGTAAIAAVWLGLREGQWRKQKNDIDESVFSELIRPEAFALSKQLEKVRALHDSARKSGIKKASSVLALETANTYGSRRTLIETRQHVQQFGALGKRRAAALARVVGSLHLLEEALQMAAHYDGDGDTELTERGLDESARLIDLIQSDLRTVLQVSIEEYQQELRRHPYGMVARSERFKSLQEKMEKKLLAGEIGE